MELEEQLRIVSIQRRKAEQAATEAISILEIHGSNDLSEAVDSSSDKDGNPSDGKECDEAFKEDEASTAPKGERLEVEDTQSSSEHEVSPSQVGSLSWKSRSSSPDFTRKLKGKQFRSKQRRISLRSSVETSPKYNLGKSCRKIKRKEMRYSLIFFLHLHCLDEFFLFNNFASPDQLLRIRVIIITFLTITNLNYLGMFQKVSHLL